MPLPGPGRRCVSSFLKGGLWICYFCVSEFVNSVNLVFLRFHLVCFWQSGWHYSETAFLPSGISTWSHQLGVVWTWWQETVSSPSHPQRCSTGPERNPMCIFILCMHFREVYLKSHEKSLVTRKREKSLLFLKMGERKTHVTPDWWALPMYLWTSWSRCSLKQC